MRYRRRTLAAIVGLLILSTAANTATRYVSDELSINLRVGPGTGYRIAQLVDAGQQLQTLSENNGWTRVRADDGTEGYVLTRFLSDEAAARTRVADLREQTEKLRRENADLKQQLAQGTSDSKEPSQGKQAILAENASLQAQLRKIRETSADSIRIGNENQRFRERLISMRSEIERLQHENEILQNRRDGMKLGALITIGGILIGLLLPLFRRRRKRSWDSF